MTVHVGRFGLLACLGVAAAITAHAQEEQPPLRANIWDVKLGMAADQIPHRDFMDFACGTNGGPPSLPLKAFTEFNKCKPEPNGLHEVQFSYDDELEYWAKANEYVTWIERYSGPKVHDHPAILSVLIDADGIARGVRIVTDPRANPRQRKEAALLKLRLEGRFGNDEEWSCVDLPPAEGEAPVARRFIKQRCTIDFEDDKWVRLEAHYYHKPGQSQFDPHSGQPQQGYFESTTRLEVLDRAFIPKDL